MSSFVWFAAALQERNGWNLPPDASVAGYGSEMDRLFMLILYITGALFVITEGALIWFAFRYRSRGAGKKGQYSHGNRRVELSWTIGTTVVLVWLALYQRESWAKIKYPERFPTKESAGVEPFRVQLIAKQFTWYFRYPGPNGKFNDDDDQIVEKMLIVPPDRPVLIQARSIDVIHSLDLPYFRVKQDIVPGMTMLIWFQVGMDEKGNYKTTKWMQIALKEEEVTGTAAAGSAKDSLIDPSLVGREDVNLKHRRLFITSGINDGEVLKIRDFDRKTGTLTFWAHYLVNPVAAGDTYKIPPFQYEVACAELCGYGHYSMRAGMKVMETVSKVEEWLDENGMPPVLADYGERGWDWE